MYKVQKQTVGFVVYLFVLAEAAKSWRPSEIGLTLKVNQLELLHLVMITVTG